MDYAMGKYDEQSMAQAEYAKPQGVAGVMAGSAVQNQSLGKQQPLHDRLQDANKRAASIAEMLATLTRAMLPPMPTDAVDAKGCENLKDSTVSGEVDDLIRTLGRISSNVSRLSVAITGAA